MILWLRYTVKMHSSAQTVCQCVYIIMNTRTHIHIMHAHTVHTTHMYAHCTHTYPQCTHNAHYTHTVYTTHTVHTHTHSVTHTAHMLHSQHTLYTQHNTHVQTIINQLQSTNITVTGEKRTRVCCELHKSNTLHTIQYCNGRRLTWVEVDGQVISR